MLLESFLPQLPTTTIDLVIFVVAIIGMILIIYSQFVELINRRDLVRILGAACLLVYALTIQNLIFIVAMAGILLASLIEFVEIYMGIHRQTDDVEQFAKQYKKDKKTKA